MFGYVWVCGSWVYGLENCGGGQEGDSLKGSDGTFVKDRVVLAGLAAVRFTV